LRVMRLMATSSSATTSISLLGIMTPWGLGCTSTTSLWVASSLILASSTPWRKLCLLFIEMLLLMLRLSSLHHRVTTSKLLIHLLLSKLLLLLIHYPAILLYTKLRSMLLLWLILLPRLRLLLLLILRLKARSYLLILWGLLMKVMACKASSSSLSLRESSFTSALTRLIRRTSILLKFITLEPLWSWT
jgi:hypothetical protein